MARVWIPAARFLALLESCGVTDDALDENGRRRVSELRRGRQECLSLEAADRTLTDLDLAYMFQFSEEDGGLADLVPPDGDNLYVPSWMAKKTAQIKRESTRRRRYDTEAERRAANREKSQKSSRRLGRLCGCGAPITNTSSACVNCYRAALPRSKHGTMSRYSHYKCRCPECRSAASTYHRARRARRMRAAA